jgi:hypothetical protein
LRSRWERVCAKDPAEPSQPNGENFNPAEIIAADLLQVEQALIIDTTTGCGWSAEGA